VVAWRGDSDETAFPVVRRRSDNAAQGMRRSWNIWPHFDARYVAILLTVYYL
jgi:hypothetical protein